MGERPWFLHLSYVKPHWPYMAPAPYHKMYGAKDCLPLNRDEHELVDQHPVLAAYRQHEESQSFQRPDAPDIVRPAYMGLIRQLDDWLGRLFDHLKKLGRFDVAGHRATGDRQAGRSYRAGWEFLHVCVDDASRLAYTEILPTERQEDTTAFLARALAWLDRHGVAVQRVMTDNGSAYRSELFRQALLKAGARHVRTRPYTPRTNGKAERFIQTALREWAYARAYDTSLQRAAELPYWIHRYNWHRPHGGIGAVPPISSLALTGNNLLRLHS